MSLTVAQLSQHLGLNCYGSTRMKLESVAAFKNAADSQLTFLVEDKAILTGDISTSSAVITTQKMADQLDARAIIISDNPQLSFAKAVDFVVSADKPAAKFHTTAIIAKTARVDPSALIAPGAIIEANAVIESGVRIGVNVAVGSYTHIKQNTRIDANVTIYPQTRIGRECWINSGTVIGSPGFGIIRDGKSWIRFPQLGKVIIGDNVDIGANCCIDRGALDDTRIESGVKLDNLIQIAHNVTIDENTVIAACTGIAGSTKIGKNCRIGGRVSIQGHITIADDVVIAAVSFVNKSITGAGMYSSSLSVQENKLWLKNHARLHRLDKITKQINRLELKLKRVFSKGEGSDK